MCQAKCGVTACVRLRYTLGKTLHSVTMFFSCLLYFWGNDGVIGAAEFLIYILYIGKHSREKTFTNFAVLWLFAVFSVKSFDLAKMTNRQKLSP